MKSLLKKFVVIPVLCSSFFISTAAAAMTIPVSPQIDALDNTMPSPHDTIASAITKMAQFTSDEANIKLQILQKAQSYYLMYDPTLHHMNVNFLSVPYENTGLILHIYLDPTDNSENFTHFYFRSEDFTVVPGQIGEWLKTETKNGKITNMETLKAKFLKDKIHDNLLSYIVHKENNELADSLVKFRTGYPFFETLDENSFQQLIELLRKTDVLIIDEALISNNGEKTGFEFGIYSFETCHKF